MRALFAGLLTGNPASLGWAALVLAVAGFAGGWMVNGWRLGIEVASLQGQNQTLTSANERCGVNVAEVKTAVAGIVKAAEKRDAAAREAMKAAAGEATGHLNAAAEIINRPQVPPEKQCDTVRDEQRDYVNTRKRVTR